MWPMQIVLTLLERNLPKHNVSIQILIPSLLEITAHNKACSYKIFCKTMAIFGAMWIENIYMSIENKLVTEKD